MAACNQEYYPDKPRVPMSGPLGVSQGGWNFRVSGKDDHESDFDLLVDPAETTTLFTGGFAREVSGLCPEPSGAAMRRRSVEHIGQAIQCAVESVERFDSPNTFHMNARTEGRRPGRIHTPVTSPDRPAATFNTMGAPIT